MPANIKSKPLNTANQSLWQALGLKVFPFALHTEYRAYALPQIWFRLLRSLQSFLRTDKLLAIFYGPQGVGKRSLVLQWLRFGRVKMPLCHIVANSSLQPAELIHKIATAFELHLNIGDDISAVIANFQQAASSFVGVRLLVIDSIETLPLTTVAVIAKLLSDQSKKNSVNLKIIATLDSSNSSLHDLFADSLSAQQILRLNMQGYDLSDTREYILHRLRAAGLSERRELDEHTLQEIYMQSGGIPAHINKLASGYSPKQLLKSLVVDQKQATGFVAKCKRWCSFNNVSSYAIGLLMSISIALVVIHRPDVTDGHVTAFNSLTPGLHLAANSGLNAQHANYDFFDTETFLKHGPVGHYGLVLATFADAKHARDFVYKSRLSGKSYYWLHDKDGKQWTAVVYGNYKTEKQAESALHKLSKSLLALKPTVHKLPHRQNI
jgi:type II secretory pathway predicted ATPase ExeA